MQSLIALKDDYLEYIELERGRSIGTIKNYDRYLTKFLQFSKALSPNDITEKLVKEFRIHLNREGANLRTQNYYLIALRGFLKYLQKIHIPCVDPSLIELARQPERQLHLIDGDEIGRLLQAISGDDLRSLRDRAIVETLFSTGARVSELISLNRDKNCIAKGEFVIRGKGGKIRTIFLNSRAQDAINAYLAKRNDLDESLFVRIPKGKIHQETDLRLTTRSVERIIKNIATKAGIIKRVVPHTLRHIFATDILEKSGNLRAVQELLGHSNISTTQIYTHYTRKDLKEFFDTYHND